MNTKKGKTMNAKKRKTVNTIDDFANYRALSVPFNSREQAKHAFAAFMAAVHSARQKYKITDCTVVVALPVKYPEPEGEGVVCTYGHMGDEVNTEIMLAFALGRAKRERREDIARLTRGKKATRSRD
jgi:allophanate hydrolase subunit 1